MWRRAPSQRRGRGLCVWRVLFSADPRERVRLGLFGQVLVLVLLLLTVEVRLVLDVAATRAWIVAMVQAEPVRLEMAAADRLLADRVPVCVHTGAHVRDCTEHASRWLAYLTNIGLRPGS